MVMNALSDSEEVKKELMQDDGFNNSRASVDGESPLIDIAVFRQLPGASCDIPFMPHRRR